VKLFSNKPWALTGAERRLLELAVLKKWTPRQVKSPYNTWSLAVCCTVLFGKRSLCAQKS
jgi:hypothetical protein